MRRICRAGCARRKRGGDHRAHEGSGEFALCEIELLQGPAQVEHLPRTPQGPGDALAQGRFQIRARLARALD